MPSATMNEADAKFPTASDNGIPPSPTRENPAGVQLSPENERDTDSTDSLNTGVPQICPNPEQKLGPSGPAFDAQQHQAHLREHMDAETRAGDALTTREGGLYSD
ncbi:hypothetical protein RHS01_03356 [Rhizoctonia solani]|uniref:Uncharacterized protein n=1 Tax=Rhizoctonia solani TaxID=456999 RepID=A0A8H7IFP6_9AGAM|nr:hypothetical protein RHS01_03356 [Rhizoctonia solani]